MIDILYQGIVTCLAAADTNSALALLNDHQNAFLDPVQGVSLHAQLIYTTIKNANKEVLQALLKLPVLSDISFYKFCGQTPLSLAVEENHKDLIPLLLLGTDKNFALHMAIRFNQIKTKSLLLKKCVFNEKLLKFLKIK